MGSGKAEKPSKSLKNPKTRSKSSKSAVKFKKQKRKLDVKTKKKIRNNNKNSEAPSPLPSLSPSPSQLRTFFLNQFQSANGVQLSSLELESIKDTCFIELSQDLGQDVNSLGNHSKAAFGTSWKNVLCEGKLVEGEIDPGSPAVLILSTSALRSIELLRGVRSLTRECHAVKLFSKHMKVEEQVASLKGRVNFASGTPSRVKKLIDIEALGLSRIKVIVLDMHTDVKGYSLLTLPQVREEFWELYKNYFHQLLVQGALSICLFGPLPDSNPLKGKSKMDKSDA